ncbi:MliC family protein [Pseudoxanthomonas sp. USHLN014]|uniref:MliC family protein n=1 Tax=Pseudoxanthomonas sp. USHLN014 TaxID=3081297 RepID=UPI00301D43E5
MPQQRQERSALRSLILLAPIALSAALAACTPTKTPEVAAPAPSPQTAPDASPPDTPIQHADYDCEGTHIAAAFFGQARAEVTLDARLLVLKPALAADGARYADDAGNAFWVKGMDRATLTLAQDPHDKICTALPPEAPQR